MNRTHFYASTRIPLSFRRLYVRIILYILPTLLFLYRSQSLLRAIRCQTSPDWWELQYGAKAKQVDMDFAGEGGWLYHGSSTLLSWEPLETSCRAVNMLPSSSTQPRVGGSLGQLWPVFMSLVFSHFIETLSCALQRVRPLQEVGMTVFEHSLAFAEAEALATRPYLSDLVVNPKQARNPFYAPDGRVLKGAVDSAMLNVPPEVLVISLISCLGHLTSNVLAIAGIRARLRFFTTATWAFAYLATFVWSFSNLTRNDIPVGVLRIPSVCVLGFIPHIVIICGIGICGVIYMTAFSLTVLSPPPGHPERMILRERFALAYSNLQANIHLSAINPVRISWQEDFYTVILKLGYTILSAATEAVFLNEGPKVNVETMTWLDKKRLREFLEARRKYRTRLVGMPRELQTQAADDIDGAIVGADNVSAGTPVNGYARERNLRNNPSAQQLNSQDTLGARHSRGRTLLAWFYLRGIQRLVSILMLKVMVFLLHKVGLANTTPWLRRLLRLPDATPKPDTASTSALEGRTEIWIRNGREIELRESDDYDVEDFARRKLRRQGVLDDANPDYTEELLNQELYGWWKKGGAFGTRDKSGDYVPPSSIEDDTTSVVSFSTAATDSSDWSDLSDGQRTPTQARPGFSRDPTPAPDASLDLKHLAHLLDPRNAEEREEARLLARHLQSPRIMTRARYRQDLEDEKFRMLPSSRISASLLSQQQQTQSPEEEERLLQDIILGRRKLDAQSNTSGNNDSAAAGTNGSSWSTGADGMGAEGPQCVVCQVNPRVILVWPCGCLSLCDECRVAMASQNYSNCACCRVRVTSFSRMYVP